MGGSRKGEGSEQWGECSLCSPLCAAVGMAGDLGDPQNPHPGSLHAHLRAAGGLAGLAQGFPVPQATISLVGPILH